MLPLPYLLHHAHRSVLPRQHENLTKQRGQKSAARATVPNADSRPPASEHPSQSVTVPIAGNDAAPAPVDIAAIVSEGVLGGLGRVY